MDDTDQILDLVHTWSVGIRPIFGYRLVVARVVGEKAVVGQGVVGEGCVWY